MKMVKRVSLTLALVFTLSGCLLISPYHGKVLTSRTASIPFQSWTTNKSTPLRVECMRTNRFGPDTTSYGPWHEISTIPVSISASRDLKGGIMYSASKEITLPDSCWYRNGSNGWYYTSLRILQENGNSGNDAQFHTVDRDGIRCVAESVADKGSWIAWVSDSCFFSYPNGDATRWMVMRTNS